MNIWLLIEWLLRKTIHALEWLATEHEDWFDALMTPLAERAVARGWL